MEYINRRNIFEKERKYILNEDHFTVEDAGNSTVVPYAGVRAVRLKYMPSRYDANIYRCTLETSKGEFILVNKYVAGVLEFRDQTPAYRNFIFELHRRLSQGGRRVRFIGGAGKTAYLMMLLFDVAMMVFLALTIIFIPFDFSFTIVIRLLLIAYLGFVTVRYFKNNRPAAYHPDSIPGRLLPAEISLTGPGSLSSPHND